MALKDRILAYLQTRPDGADDGEIERALGVRYHAQVNSRCRELAAAGLLQRRKVGRTFRNFLTSGAEAEHAPSPAQAVQATPPADKQGGEDAPSDHPWHWEGNVQSAVVSYLAASGHRISRVADTASRETGKDIIAVTPSGQQLWVSVKGYPKGTDKTHPATQARHWFKQATFDIVAWRNESSEAQLAMAIPDFQTYRSLAQRLDWLQRTARFAFLWVQESGDVSTAGELE